jgi:hypothetical protein
MAKSQRQTMREAKRRRERQQKILLYGGLGAAVVAAVVLIVLLTQTNPASAQIMGDPVAISSSAHIPESDQPGPYASNPPAGGPHYESVLTARFYEESDLAGLIANPEGSLVHNLEHGYVIFWYNCQADGVNCDDLKQTIQEVMDETGRTKLIAFPWPDMEVPLAMTSWGRILEFSQVDAGLMKQFVLGNRYKAPEPNGQ